MVKRESLSTSFGQKLKGWRKPQESLDENCLEGVVQAIGHYVMMRSIFP